MYYRSGLEGKQETGLLVLKVQNHNCKQNCIAMIYIFVTVKTDFNKSILKSTLHEFLYFWPKTKP